MSPDFKVGIFNANDEVVEVVEVRLLTLTAWVHALRLEMKGLTLSGSGPKVSTIARKFLGAKPSYKIADLYNHLNTSLTDIKGQLGLPT